MQESDEPELTTEGILAAPPAKKIKGLCVILKRIVQEKRNEHDDSRPPQEVVQKDPLNCSNRLSNILS